MTIHSPENPNAIGNAAIASGLKLNEKPGMVLYHCVDQYYFIFGVLLLSTQLDLESPRKHTFEHACAF